MPEVKFHGKWTGVLNGKRVKAAANEVVDVPEYAATLLTKNFGLAERVKVEEPEAPTEPQGENPADTRETKTNPDADTRETREADGDNGDDAPKSEPTAKAVREWAKSNDIDVPARGAIPADVRAAFDAAHADN